MPDLQLIIAGQADETNRQTNTQTGTKSKARNITVQHTDVEEREMPGVSDVDFEKEERRGQ